MATKHYFVKWSVYDAKYKDHKDTRSTVIEINDQDGAADNAREQVIQHIMEEFPNRRYCIEEIILVEGPQTP
jgi:hypothetical protein